MELSGGGGPGRCRVCVFWCGTMEHASHAAHNLKEGCRTSSAFAGNTVCMLI